MGQESEAGDMRGLDDTDREILRILLADSRRPYSDIAEAVDLSAPAVSDRIDRLEALGVIRRFTIDIDRTLLTNGTRVLLTVQASPGAGPKLREVLEDVQAVEHLFLTADDTLVCTVVSGGDVGDLLAAHLPTEEVQHYDVRLLRESSWTPTVEQAEFRPDCVECGNLVTNQGEQERLDGRVYHFCCPSCRDSFLDQYQELREGVDG